MNQSDDFGKILKLWPNLVDHYNNRIHKAWASALRLDIFNAQGLIHFPENAQYLLCRNQADFTYIYQDLFKRLSYFAKTDTKIYGNGNHNFGCSRVSGRLQSW